MTHDSGGVESIIEPTLPIVDPHHHLWLIPTTALDAMTEPANFVPVVKRVARYLFDDFLADVQSGHNIVATVFAECISMYRPDGPDAYRSLGEVEFANGAAAMAASGNFGRTRVCAGIIGYVDLRLGDSALPVLESHLSAAGARYKGVRNMAHYDPDPSVLGNWAVHPKGLLLDSQFRRGLAAVQSLGLSFDTYVLEPQLADVVDLAHAFPNLPIVLDHLGTPIAVGRYAERRKERFQIWRTNMLALAKCDNVIVKLGGLGMPFAGLPSYQSAKPAGSEQLAEEWRPYMETVIEAFGSSRCMFESNYPNDSGTCSYPVLWNTFKRLTATASRSEKADLFSETAARTYRLTDLHR